MSEYDEPHYRSVTHALVCAFNNRAPYLSLCAVGDVSGGGSSWDERAGDAGLVKSEIKETLSGVHKHVIYAQFVSVDSDSASELQDKHNAIEYLTARLHAENAYMKEAYVRHVVETWAGISQLVTYKGDLVPATDEYWAEKLGVTTRTLRSWRNGRMTQGKNKTIGLNELLDRWGNAAIGILKPKFKQNGWVA